MSSPASRKRQRQRRRAQEKLWAAQRALTTRQADLAAYDRVVADMDRRYGESSFAGSRALELVTILRDGVRIHCEQLTATVADLKRACETLKPTAATSDPQETMAP